MDSVRHCQTANKTCQFLLVPHRKSSTVHCTLIRLGKTPYIKTNKACNKMRLCNQFHLPMTEYAPIDFSKVKFKPVFEWPEGVTPVVLDLSGKDANAFTATPFTIGKYNEKRGIYTTELFTTPGGNRCVHVGIDLGGPVGHPVYLPYDGTIAFQGYNAAEGDYGNCVITKHIIQDQTLYMLFGHLDGKSIGHDADKLLPAGYMIGRLGDRHENGGWPAHVHFQLSRRTPTTHDLPGAVTEADVPQALVEFPDPQVS